MTVNAGTPDPASAVEPPAPTVWAAFQARDPRRVIDFLVEVFGFEPTAVVEDGGTVVHAQLDWPEGGGVMLGAHKQTGYSRPPGTAGLYVVTGRIHDVHQRARDHGLDVPDLVEQDYGSTEFTVADPEGNLWTFGTYRGEPRRAGQQ